MKPFLCRDLDTSKLLARRSEAAKPCFTNVNLGVSRKHDSQCCRLPSVYAVHEGGRRQDST